MPTLYMTLWSIVFIGALAWRLGSWGKLIGVMVVTAVVLIFSQALFMQLTINAGLDPSTVLINPAAFLNAGPLGWLALLVRPCGWLGPILGLNLVERWPGEWETAR